MTTKGSSPPPDYQAIPQPGGAQSSFPSEPPPKYEPAPGYPNPPQAYPPQAYPPQQGYQTVYTQQPMIVNVVNNNEFNCSPKQVQCPYCQAVVTTTTEYEAGGLTWLSSGLICLIGCWLGCCLIPFCINDLQDVKHKCSNCNRQIAVYRRI